MGIKDKLKTGVQRNLNQKYIRRLLDIISKKPVLYAYGSTFSSLSDKYLNIFTIESLRNAYSDNNHPVGYGSLFLPYEMFHALGITPFLPEVMAGFTAGLGLATPRHLKNPLQTGTYRTCVHFIEVHPVQWNLMYFQSRILSSLPIWPAMPRKNHFIYTR